MDLTNLFANAFGKHELVKSGQITSYEQAVDTPTKIIPENNEAVKQHNASLYPERIGKRKRIEKEDAEKAYKSFLETITEDEANNLVILSKDRLILSKSQLIAMGESGEDLCTERLEEAGCIKREKIPDDDLIQFSITGQGRKVMNDLNRLLGR